MPKRAEGSRLQIASQQHVTGVAGCSGIGGRIKSEWVAGYFRNQWPDDPGIRSELLHRIREGEIDTTSLISHLLPLEDAVRGYQSFRYNQNEWIKVVLKTGTEVRP